MVEENLKNPNQNLLTKTTLEDMRVNLVRVNLLTDTSEGDWPF